MTSEDLANLLVAHFNGLDEKPIEYKATNPEVVDVEKERADWAVFVQAFEESEESIDNADTCEEVLRCNVVVHGPVNHQTTKAKGIEFLKFLRISLRETELGGYLWRSNETVSLFDFDALNVQRMFVSWFTVEFYSYE